MTSPIRVCARVVNPIDEATTFRVCGSDTKTAVHVVLHCHAIALWPVLAEVGLNRVDTDDITLCFEPQHAK